MKAIIQLDVPEWQIGQDVSVYFPDTMLKHGKCELLKDHNMDEQKIMWNEMIHPDVEAIKKRDTFLSDENGKKLREMIDQEPLQPTWKSECMNTKIDMVEVVRCKHCIHWRKDEVAHLCILTGDLRRGDWFCADGERW